MATALLFPNNYFPDIIKAATAIGITAASTVILGATTSGKNNLQYFDWRDLALYGTIGSIIGSHWVKHGLRFT